MASQEAYVPPSSSTFAAGGTFNAGAGAGGGGGPGGLPSGAAADPRSATMEYICADCAGKVTLKKGDLIRCRDCGHRILYKQRTKRMVQFEAR